MPEGPRWIIREQARSHRGASVRHESWNQDVGAGLLAKAVGLPASMLDVPTPSRAGSLPQWVPGVHATPTHRSPCGSEPARDSVSLGNNVPTCSR
ncbi:protein of unknown function [Pseudomonas mediterranea]